jgi:hypothetical protein
MLRGNATSQSRVTWWFADKAIPQHHYSVKRIYDFSSILGWQMMAKLQ